MKFYGQFNPPLDQWLYEKYFLNFKGKGTSLECGAVDGENISTTKFFEESLGWQTINIEPHKDSFKELIKNRPRSININIALSDSNGISNLVYGKNFFLRSYLIDNPTTQKTMTVETKTYRDAINDLPIDKIDLMVLDVEGHEKRAIFGMYGAKILPHIICVEVNHSGRHNVREAIEVMGYKFDAKYTINDIYIKT